MPLKSKKIKASLLVLFFSAAYLVLSYYLIGFKTDQLVLVGLFNFMYYVSAVTRKFILGFTVFIVFWIIFDYMKAFPNYNYNTVSILRVGFIHGGCRQKFQSWSRSSIYAADTSN